MQSTMVAPYTEISTMSFVAILDALTVDCSKTEKKGQIS
jgi:hypothetical protein